MTSAELSLASATAPAAGLPVSLAPFIGRDRELDDLVRLAAGKRLLTLTGAGGSGKTRLALETALRSAASFARVGWVDLVPISEPTLLPQLVSEALRVPERPGIAPLELLTDDIANDRFLLVLDNCEHLVDACAALVETLLRSCPRLAIIATSREALGVAGETAWLVPPLADREAIELFVERARSVLPSFTRTPANGAAIEEICRRLDGIPLAIELAAARIRVLSPEQIARRLDDAFHLLSAGSRTALPRHRTLRATMEWSFALLGARERLLLDRLAVFAGTFNLDAAEQVCAGGPLQAEDILDGVAALVDRSLVVMEPDDGAARYRLLETVRQYCMERLAASGERDELEARFAGYYLSLVEAMAPKLLGGPTEQGVVERLTTEHDNIRAASNWAAADEARAEVALRFVGALYWFWYALGQFREARDATSRALALATMEIDPLLRGRALLTSALTALAQGRYPAARADFEAALPLLREGGDVQGTGTALAKYGAAWLLDGDVDRAISALEEALAFREGATEPDIGLIFARFWRGWAAYAKGDFDTARRLATANVATGRAFALPTTLGHSLSTLAQLELACGNFERACSLVSEALEIEVANGDQWGMAIALDVIAIIAARRGRRDDATRLLGAVEANRKRLSAALPGLALAERDALTAELRAALGTRFDELYAEGSLLSQTETVGRAAAEAARHTGEHRAVRALPRKERAERRPLRVLALGQLQVYIDGALVDSAAWGSARPRELLVYLLVHPDGRTKEQVGLAFWPDASTAQLRNNFHVTLHRLRKALGNPDWIVFANDRYRVDPAVVEEFDALEFEREVVAARRALAPGEQDSVSRLERALARFRGDFLDGEPVGDWHVEHRDRLQRLYVDALMELGARLSEEERHGRAAEAYRRVLARDELHEQALLELMRSYARLGERSQAMRAYQCFAERLRREMDAEPDEETASLFERLQRGADGVRA
jgi:predicted ATPase/DNA-binding SARP family transcriptional activator